MAWNPKNRSIELYSNYGSIGTLVFDPVARTTACTITPWSTGSSATADWGWNIDVNPSTGELYYPVRWVGTTPNATGSVKVYRV